MSNDEIIRAWKDEEYRNSLNAERKAQLPENPAGIADLTDEELNEVIGGLTIPALTKFLRCGRKLTLTAECRCPRTVTGGCRCPI